MKITLTPDEVQFAISQFLDERKIQAPPAAVQLSNGDPKMEHSYFISDVYAVVEVPA
jgi:hypothetical protein